MNKWDPEPVEPIEMKGGKGSLEIWRFEKWIGVKPEQGECWLMSAQAKSYSNTLIDFKSKITSMFGPIREILRISMWAGVSRASERTETHLCPSETQRFTSSVSQSLRSTDVRSLSTEIHLGAEKVGRVATGVSCSPTRAYSRTLLSTGENDSALFDLHRSATRKQGGREFWAKLNLACAERATI